MPSPDTAVRARHLLRGLLREATYLPDAAARSFVHYRVLARFRDYPADAANLTADRLSTVLSSGDKQLRFLKRANNGERAALLKVLQYTYGRVGKRRHELMAPLKRATELPDGIVNVPPVDIPPVEVPAGVAGPFAQGQRLQFRIAPSHSLLQALLDAQAGHERTKPAKLLTHSMPDVNAWGRSMPRKRQKNVAKKWWAKTLHDVLPPLPGDEWRRLRDLATGKMPWAGPPKRRAILERNPAGMSVDMVQSMVKFGGTDRLTRQNHLQHQPISSGPACVRLPRDEAVQEAAVGAESALAAPVKPAVTRESDLFGDADFAQSRMDVLLGDALGIRKLNKKLAKPNDGGHNLTPRFMRRLWREVLDQCPYVTWDEAESGWAVYWYEEGQAEPRQNVPQPA